jgi:hypothetical protein
VRSEEVVVLVVAAAEGEDHDLCEADHVLTAVADRLG